MSITYAMKKLPIFITLILCTQILWAQMLTQTVRGVIRDEQSGSPLPGATILVAGSDPILGTISDNDGNFTLENVPVGRQTLVISMLGFQPTSFNNVIIASAKESYFEVKLLESVTKLDEVVVSSEKDNSQSLNEFAAVSARQFSLDEATRYAGGFNDPARMAMNFAGVSSSADLRNDIVVRGNSPTFVLYRIEGIPVPNPNHFGTFGGAGGAISMISQNMLSNSDFLTSAFPSEFGNVLGGVFDINFRRGNGQKREHVVQLGMRGLELSTEGPFSKNSNASYLVNYRYSTLGVFDALGLDIGVPAIPEYQDLSFKVDVPTKGKFGRFSVFGLGGLATITLKDSEAEKPEDQFNQDKPGDIFNQTRMAVIGFSNDHFFSKKTSGRLTLSFSNSRDRYTYDTLSSPDFVQTTRYADGLFQEFKTSLWYKLSHKFSARDLVQTGFLIDFSQSNFKENAILNGVYQSNTDFKGNYNLYQGFVQWQHRFSDRVSFNAGYHVQYHDLTGSIANEPRLGFSWNFARNQTLSMGSGLHAQTLPANVYFMTETLPDGSKVNKNQELDFLRSAHFVLGYQNKFAPDWRIKIETYYQQLYDIPVESNPSTFSAINTGADFNGFPNDLDPLVNKGDGRNVGMELTLEKFFSHNYYMLFTTSLFDSKYQGSDGVLRNSAFNRNYIFNILAGKEFYLGRSDNKTFGLNGKINWSGGAPYIPIDADASQAQGQRIYDYSRAYDPRYSDYFRFDLKFSYTVNRPKMTHQVSLDIQNVTNNENLFQENYNVSTGEFTQEYQTGMLPELQYRILF
jgi:CarboxypepD_reg-like domain/TonB dependent receptor-like, beta-barrel